MTTDYDGPLVELTVLLIPQAHLALQGTAVRRGDSETDVTNQALQAWAFIDAAMSMGAELFMRYPNGDMYRFEPEVGSDPRS